MNRHGREVQTIAERELLYQRLPKSGIDDSGEIRDAMIKAPDQSVNRAGCGGRAWFALMPEPTEDEVAYQRKKLCMGVIAFQTRTVSFSVSLDSQPEKPVFTFRVEHAPENHNYHHCEIRTYVNGQRLTEEEAKRLKGTDGASLKLAKKDYRTRFRQAYERHDVRFVLDAEDSEGVAWHRRVPLACLARFWS